MQALYNLTDVSDSTKQPLGLAVAAGYFRSGSAIFPILWGQLGSKNKVWLGIRFSRSATPLPQPSTIDWSKRNWCVFQWIWWETCVFLAFHHAESLDVLRPATTLNNWPSCASRACQSQCLASSCHMGKTKCPHQVYLRCPISIAITLKQSS